MSKNTWTVYRDGDRWDVPVEDMSDALDRAQWAVVYRTYGELRAGKPRETYLRKGTQLQRDVAPPEPCTLPALYFVKGTARTRELSMYAVYMLSPNVLRADFIPEEEGLTLRQAVDVLEGAVANSVAIASTRPHYVRTYVAGQRAGQPRFRAADGEAKRAQVLKRHAENQQRARDLASSRWCIAQTLEALVNMASPDTLPGEDMSAAQAECVEIRKLGSAYLDAPGEAQASALAQWLRDRERAIAEETQRRANVREYGFPVGAECEIVADEWDELSGAAVVVKVCSSADDDLRGDRCVRKHADGSEHWLFATRLQPREQRSVGV